MKIDRYHAGRCTGVPLRKACTAKGQSTGMLPGTAQSNKMGAVLQTDSLYSLGCPLCCARVPHVQRRSETGVHICTEQAVTEAVDGPVPEAQALFPF